MNDESVFEVWQVDNNIDMAVRHVATFPSTEAQAAVDCARREAREDPCDYNDYQYRIKIVQVKWSESFPAGHD